MTRDNLLFSCNKTTFKSQGGAGDPQLLQEVVCVNTGEFYFIVCLFLICTFTVIFVTVLSHILPKPAFVMPNSFPWKLPTETTFHN